MTKEEFAALNVSDTKDIASGMAKSARPGAVFALCGPMGAGKTVFAKGFATGLGVTEEVASPTYTICCEYESKTVPLYHFDLYRLSDEDELWEIGFEEYPKKGGICLIEWADLFPEAMPEDTVWIRIAADDENPDKRIITVET